MRYTGHLLSRLILLKHTVIKYKVISLKFKDKEKRTLILVIVKNKKNKYK